IQESKHEALEEMFFWPAVREKLPDGDKLAGTAIGQEQEGKDVLDKLDKLEADDAKFEKLVTKFIERGRTHITYEETRVWPPLRNALSAEEASQIGTKIEQGKKAAPTRPHPHTPPSPGVLKSAGPAAASADRARDKATGRGEKPMWVFLSSRLRTWLLLAIALPLARLLVHRLAVAADHHDPS